MLSLPAIEFDKTGIKKVKDIIDKKTNGIYRVRKLAWHVK
jgi:hypothetical protein